MIKKCIGIISYLPDNEKREIRLKRLNETLKSCDDIMNLPIIIIAQNWKNDDVKLSNNCIVYHYEKLGIPLARNTLREKFLESEFDYLIMLDDDCVLEGNATKYLKEIDNHPNGVGTKYFKLLKLYAISKHIYSQIEIPNVDAEKNEGAEDTIFTAMISKNFLKDYFQFEENDLNINIGKSMEYSTWRHKGTRLNLLLENTSKIVKAIKR